MEFAPDNREMVDQKYLPPFPHQSPDPASCESFAEWVRDLTKKGSGVSQRVLAEVAGVSPQAVTKWLKGGDIDVEKLVRIAEWSGYAYLALRRLVDERRLRLAPSNVAEAKATYRAADELGQLWNKLTDDNRQQLLGMAKVLLAKQIKKRPSKD